MQIDPASQTEADNYRLFTSLVVPRPIAWVSTLNPDGGVNLAPYSFFNAIGANPLYLILSIAERAAGQPKDTARNILANGEFVVNMVTEELLDAMNLSAADFPEGESELDAAGLHAAASVSITTPRIAEARASLECRLHSHQKLGEYTLVIGEVVMFHVDDVLVGEDGRVSGFAPIGRMGSPSVYCRTADSFDLPRIGYEEWRVKQG